MRKIATNKASMLAMSSCLLFSAVSEGALINRGSGMVYDDVLDVTWLQDANYMVTSGASASSFVNKATASSWVNSLVFGGYDDWRLPTMLPSNGVSYNTSFTFNGTSDRGFNNGGTNNELGYMFYQNLSNVSFFSPAGIGNQPGSDSFSSSFTDGNSGIMYSFENIALTYWADPSNTPFANASWGFNMQNFNGLATGETQLHGLFSGLSVWAVRDGDVADTLVVSDPAPDPKPAVGVPEPGSLGLLAFGLAGFMAVRRQSRV